MPRLAVQRASSEDQAVPVGGAFGGDLTPDKVSGPSVTESTALPSSSRTLIAAAPFVGNLGSSVLIPRLLA